MSRLWPHTPFAEDQPFSHAILYTHILTRGLTVGTLAGPILRTPIFLLRQFNILSPSRAILLSFPRLILRSSASGAAIGTLLMIPGTIYYMWGREEIEWKDRSWRLLENKGQKEVDDWTYVGMAAGLGYGLQREGLSGWRGKAGGVGLGSVLGMVGYMGWRYGVKGGRFEEVKEP